jgi:hypothetical protein
MKNTHLFSYTNEVHNEDLHGVTKEQICIRTIRSDKENKDLQTKTQQYMMIHIELNMIIALTPDNPGYDPPWMLLDW